MWQEAACFRGLAEGVNEYAPQRARCLHYAKEQGGEDGAEAPYRGEIKEDGPKRGGLVRPWDGSGQDVPVQGKKKAHGCGDQADDQRPGAAGAAKSEDCFAHAKKEVYLGEGRCNQHNQAEKGEESSLGHHSGVYTESGKI